ncbi:hypothetical protein E2C01_092766 [Portunus trituberculatus]|uniref:Uncharacterized protein n=1 Tax=Portunus trituberculatus TaxID=210409 RepID=A0A5B7JRH3_PORTR|nr:hypothetical protein [Portunus trituberculatus]
MSVASAPLLCRLGLGSRTAPLSHMSPHYQPHNTPAPRHGGSARTGGAALAG